MSSSDQKGFAHILGLLLLLVGLGVSVYLVQHKTNLFSKASETKKEEPDYVQIQPLAGEKSPQSLVVGSEKPIYNFTVSGDVLLNKDNSYVRVVLIDTNNSEYLVYETYPAISDSNNFSVTSVCEETCYLNGIISASLRIEGNTSSFTITSTSFSDKLSPEVQSQDIPNRAMAIKRDKDQAKIQKLKLLADQKKITWTAGETSVSRMTYAQKRKLFPGLDGKLLDHLPNLQGFEYYKGGIFEIGGKSISSRQTTTSSSSSNNYPSSLDYRNWQGENWMTPVKDQGYCGSCWAFAATGATEALVNLYFNQHIDLDLSEQDGLGCSGAGSCYGGQPGLALDYYTNTGVVSESCLPYQGRSYYCPKCSTWQNEVTKISGKEEYIDIGENWLKEKLLKRGVLSSGYVPWSHAMALVGWETDSFDYQTVWIFKNSWGEGWGEGGYVRFKTQASNMGWTYALLTPVNIANREIQVACVDKDGDGYCNWGISENKPSTCSSSCKPEKDCDDSNPALGPYDSCLPNLTSLGCSTTNPNCPSGYKCQMQACTLVICPDNNPNCNTCTGKCVPIPTPRVTPRPSHNLVFITNTTYNGNLGGLVGADAKCQERANVADLGGTWKVWLSDSSTSASSRLIHSNDPYKLVNGTIIANNWTDLTDGTLQNPINRTEFNTIPTEMSCVWTSTDIDGSLIPPAANLNGCYDYTVAGSDYNSICGRNGSTDSNWTKWSTNRCDQVSRLYCFEQVSTGSAQVAVISCSACSANVRGDGKVSIADMMIVARCMGMGSSGSVGQYSCQKADVNGDGKINASDLNCVREQFGKQYSP